MRVVEALEKNVPDIVSVELTRAFEEKMDGIMAGKAKRDEVIEESKEQLIKILKVFKEKELDVGKMLLETTGTGVTTAKDSTVEKSSGRPAKSGIEGPKKSSERLVLGKCPKCGGDLVLKYNRKTGKRFVGCSNWPKCNVTYPILQRGEVIPTGKTCCNGAPVVKIRERGKEYEICLDMKCKGWKKSG